MKLKGWIYQLIGAVLFFYGIAFTYLSITFFIGRNAVWNIEWSVHFFIYIVMIAIGSVLLFKGRKILKT
jgi:hypothetical protein